MRVLRISQRFYFVRQPVGVKQKESKPIKEPKVYETTFPVVFSFIIFRITQQKDCSWDYDIVTPQPQSSKLLH